ncbi:hypothetical protein P5P86_02545 [Nocardioides sp. BP30]|uniref:hypothetical protein n=1 Tax=Nocardioides sp. BP30 TaxID=3036374 RepID=UPI0024694CFC|nr:hypothetical protein [Nocardioides sp. BP30]WGL52712.1 hypothetical protein P5P86_02545 [Nocardioides sp. BP30]
MSSYLAPTEADRLRRAEIRWLEQARERLRRPAPATRRTDPPETRTEETDR